VLRLLEGEVASDHTLGRVVDHGVHLAPFGVDVPTKPVQADSAG
jgi:hypothetical protein